MSWGKRKDGQAYPKNKKSGIKKSGTTIAGGKKFPPTIQHKKIESHLYRIYQYQSSEWENDREEIAHVRAKDIDQATEFVKKKFFAKNIKHEDIDDDWGGMDDSTTVSVSYAVNENGGHNTHNKIDDNKNREQYHCLLCCNFLKPELVYFIDNYYQYNECCKLE